MLPGISSSLQRVDMEQQQKDAMPGGGTKAALNQSSSNQATNTTYEETSLRPLDTRSSPTFCHLSSNAHTSEAPTLPRVPQVHLNTAQMQQVASFIQQLLQQQQPPAPGALASIAATQHSQHAAQLSSQADASLPALPLDTSSSQVATQTAMQVDADEASGSPTCNMPLRILPLKIDPVTATGGLVHPTPYRGPQSEGAPPASEAPTALSVSTGFKAGGGNAGNRASEDLPLVYRELVLGSKPHEDGAAHTQRQHSAELCWPRSKPRQASMRPAQNQPAPQGTAQPNQPPAQQPASIIDQLGMLMSAISGGAGKGASAQPPALPPPLDPQTISMLQAFLHAPPPVQAALPALLAQAPPAPALPASSSKKRKGSECPEESVPLCKTVRQESGFQPFSKAGVSPPSANKQTPAQPAVNDSKAGSGAKAAPMSTLLQMLSSGASQGITSELMTAMHAAANAIAPGTVAWQRAQQQRCAPAQKPAPAPAQVVEVQVENSPRKVEGFRPEVGGSSPKSCAGWGPCMQQMRSDGFGAPMLPPMMGGMPPWLMPRSAMEVMQQQAHMLHECIQDGLYKPLPQFSLPNGAHQARRRGALEKFQIKRKRRTYTPKVRYLTRKKLAQARPRVKGQFVRQEVAAAYQAELEKRRMEDSARDQSNTHSSGHDKLMQLPSSSHQGDHSSSAAAHESPSQMMACQLGAADANEKEMEVESGEGSASGGALEPCTDCQEEEVG